MYKGYFEGLSFFECIQGLHHSSQQLQNMRVLSLSGYSRKGGLFRFFNLRARFRTSLAGIQTPICTSFGVQESETMGENEMIHPHLSPNIRNRELEMKNVEMNELRKNKNGNNSALHLQYDSITGVYPTNEFI
jgi:hypothetical protein